MGKKLVNLILAVILAVSLVGTVPSYASVPEKPADEAALASEAASPDGSSGEISDSGDSGAGISEDSGELTGEPGEGPGEPETPEEPGGTETPEEPGGTEEPEAADDPDKSNDSNDADDPDKSDDSNDQDDPDKSDDSNDPDESDESDNTADSEESEKDAEEDLGEEGELPLMGEDANIEDGWYRIATAIDTNYVLDVAGGLTDIRTNIQIYPNNGTAAQIFYVQRSEDGSYTIRNRKSSYYLNVAHGETEKGANIWQYRDDGTLAIQFRIVETDAEGYCKIVSVLNDLPLDVKGGKAEKRTNVQLWRDNGTAAQMWQFLPVPEREPTTVKSGYYTLANIGQTPQVLDIKSAGTADKTGTQIHKSNGTAAQIFYLESDTDGTCTIMACCSGKYLTTASGTMTNGAAVAQMAPTGGNEQKWKIFNAGGYLQISPASEEELVMSVRGGAGSDAADVILRPVSESEDQLWQKTAASEPNIAPATGLYTVRVSGQTRYVLDVDNAATGTANIRIHHSNGTNAQKFLFMTNSDGSFTIVNAGSFMAVDVKSAGTADGTNVQQHTANTNSDAQKWTVKGCPGRYRIVSACGNKPMSVAGAVDENSNIMISTDKAAGTQRFALEKTTTNAAPLNKQFYRITTAKNTAMAVDVPDAGYAEGLLMRIHRSNYTDAQKWQFISTGDGYYVIMNVKNGLCLTAKAYGGSSWGSAKGTTVIQYNEIEGNSYKQYQKWKPVPAGDGSYYLQSAANGLYLDVKGGSTAQDTPLQVYPGNNTAAQRFFINRVSTSCYIRWHDYATDSRGVRHWLEGTFWDDPRVSDVDFMAAAIYTEGGSQGLAGMMMIGYSMLNRGSLQDLRYTIYEYGQYQICRDGALTRILKAISTNSTAGYNNLDTCRTAAKNCASGLPIRLTSPATVTYPGGQRILGANSYLTRSDFSIYNGFMTPGAWQRHGFTTANKHTVTYLSHIYYVTAEVW